jgi:hypothetical protein
MKPVPQDLVRKVTFTSDQVQLEAASAIGSQQPQDILFTKQKSTYKPLFDEEIKMINLDIEQEY